MENECLIAVDVETTGLNPNDSELLEVAAVMTDTQGNKISDFFKAVIYHEDVENLKAKTNEYVLEMHEKNGLWDKLNEGEDLITVDEKLLNFVKTYAPNKRQARLMGNSCRLDLNFMEVFLPKTYNHLHYRSVDVSALAYVLEQNNIVDGNYPKIKAHTAESDINETINEYKWLLSKVVSEA